MVRAASQPDNTRACYSKLASKRWIGPRIFGTHSLRRTKAALIYRRTGNLRAVQLLLGHTKIESTVCYLGRCGRHTRGEAKRKSEDD
jgi:integrase